MIPVKIIRKTKATAAAPTAAAAQNIDTGLLLPRTLFDDLFQKVLITPPVIDDDGNVTTPARYAIQANYDLYSIGGLSGYRHSGKPAGGSADGIDIEQFLTDGTPVAAINGVTIYAPQAAAGASTWAELTGKPAWLTDTDPGYATLQYTEATYLKQATLDALFSTVPYDDATWDTAISAKLPLLTKKIDTQGYSATTGQLTVQGTASFHKTVAFQTVTQFGGELQAAGHHAHLGTLTVNDYVKVTGSLTVGSTLNCEGSIKPSTSFTLYVGNKDRYFKGAYLSCLYLKAEDDDAYKTTLRTRTATADTTIYLPASPGTLALLTDTVAAAEGIGKPYGDFTGLRSYYWDKNDNNGYPTYLLISKVCAASEWSSWGAGHPMYGISGTVYGSRSGNMDGTGTWHVNAAVSYSTDYIKTETSDATYMQPCVVTYGGNVYVALRLLGSGYDMMFLGSGYNLLDTPIQVNCTDLSGTCPSVTVLRDYTGVNLTAYKLTADNGGIVSKGDVTADGHLYVQGETRLNGSVYLPDAFTFFGTSGIYVYANRPGEKYGSAAFIGVHQGYAGTDTVATVNLDGTVRLWHCLAINQDPDTDASLRVGGLSKLDYLTLGGMARPYGYWLAAPSGYFGNPSSGTYTSFGDGGIKLSHPTTPYIDFHWNKSTPDYTSRLIASEDGVLMIDSATADPALRIGNAYLRYDAINNALYVTGRDGAQVNLYATGGIAAYSAIGSVTQLANLQLTGQLTARSAAFTGMVQASYILLDNFTIDTNNEYLEIRYNGLDYAENQLVLDVYGDIYSEGYLYVNGKTWLNETYIGSQASTYKITGIYADGINVYITINGKKYKLANA